MKKAVSLKVNPELWKEARLQAFIQGIPLNEFVEQALKEKIERERK